MKNHTLHLPGSPRLDVVVRDLTIAVLFGGIYFLLLGIRSETHGLAETVSQTRVIQSTMQTTLTILRTEVTALQEEMKEIRKLVTKLKDPPPHAPPKRD